MNAHIKRTPSRQAQVAKAMKQFCKSLGVTVSAKSDSFSMGDSVSVTMEDQPPEIFKKIEEHGAQYQYGHFDGMQDMYEYSNHRDDIPQTKYLHIENRFSDDLKRDAYAFLRAAFPGNFEDAPETYEAGEARSVRIFDEYADEVLYRFLRGSSLFLDEKTAEFWAARRTVTNTPAAAVSVGAVRIEEHTHTKKGFQMHIVILPGRVDRDTFDTLRDRAKSFGGWYSRAWGQTPGGFAFKARDKAEEFAAGIDDGTAPPDPDKPTGNQDMADRLRGAADRMQTAIDDKFRDRLTNTPKRQRQAASARLDGERLERTQQALRALADLHEAGTVPPVLAGVKTKSAVYDAMRSEWDTSRSGYYDAPVCLNRPADNDAITLGLWELIKRKSPEELRTEELRRAVENAKRAKINGYFPTPAKVISRMLDHADVRPGHKVLEPSAGSGDITDAVTTAEPSAVVVCYEISGTLREILELKGYAPGWDFMEARGMTQEFDRVLMNPPFEKLQDIDHVRHAFDCLKPGGRLVAIMSPSGFFQSTRRAVEFREWFDDLAGEVYDLPAGSFKDSGTDVHAKLVVIDKPQER